MRRLGEQDCYIIGHMVNGKITRDEVFQSCPDNTTLIGRQVQLIN